MAVDCHSVNATCHPPPQTSSTSSFAAVVDTTTPPFTTTLVEMVTVTVDTWVNPPPLRDFHEYLDHLQWVAEEVIPKVDSSPYGLMFSGTASNPIVPLGHRTRGSAPAARV